MTLSYIDPEKKFMKVTCDHCNRYYPLLTGDRTPYGWGGIKTNTWMDKGIYQEYNICPNCMKLLIERAE